MRIPFSNLFITSPFEGLEEHSAKVKECAWAFKRAIECFLKSECEEFDVLCNDVRALENEADVIKRRIRGHLPKGILLPVDKFTLFRYLREEDHVLDAVKDTLEWISFRGDKPIPEPLQEQYMELVNSVIGPIEELNRMVVGARDYFNSHSEEKRILVKEIISNIRKMESEADIIEGKLKQKIFSIELDAVTVYHMIRLVELTGDVADYAENAGDMMRSMVAR